MKNHKFPLIYNCDNDDIGARTHCLYEFVADGDESKGTRV